MTGRPGVVALIRGMIRDLEGINVTDEEELTELLQRDMNRVDTSRYEHQGVYQMPVHVNSTKDRCGARTYIAATLHARNDDSSPRYPLTLSANSLATRVLFSTPANSSEKPRATGVEFMIGEGLYAADDRYNASECGQIKRVTATREVIVSGGSYNTPQLLKLSGIGPRSELEQFGIPLIADLSSVVRLQPCWKGSKGEY